MKIKLGFLCFVLVFFLACGGGDSTTDDDSSGNEGAGVIDDSAEAMAVAARETSAQIIASESGVAGLVPMLSSIASFPEIEAEKNPLSVSSTNGLIQIAETTTETESEPGECGGTLVRTTDTTTDDENLYPMEVDADWLFNDYCLEDDDEQYWIEFNGSMNVNYYYTSLGNGTSHFEYDLSYTSNLPFYLSGSLSYAKYCTIENGVQECSVGVHESETTTYYTENVSVSGNASSGYDISYLLADSDGHTYSVEFSDLTRCENGGIGSGGGIINYNGEEIIIDFTDCGEYVVSYDGNSETYYY